MLYVSGQQQLWSPTGHLNFPKPVGAAPVGTEQGAEAEPGLFGHRMFPWTTTELLSTLPSAGTLHSQSKLLAHVEVPGLSHRPFLALSSRSSRQR